VNNTVFFRWFEDARIALFERVGLTTTTPTGAAPILASTTCDFLAPVTYPATVVAGCRVAKLGRTSFVTEYEVRCGDVLVGRGSGVLVLVDYGTGEKVPLSDALRAALEQYA
jgi:acyl-CoA thioester hydrolase